MNECDSFFHSAESSHIKRLVLLCGLPIHFIWTLNVFSDGTELHVNQHKPPDDESQQSDKAFLFEPPPSCERAHNT